MEHSISSSFPCTVLNEIILSPNFTLNIIVGYGVDDREVMVRIPARTRDFSGLRTIRTDFGAQWTVYSGLPETSFGAVGG
jgi:hypothetical protein